MSRRRRRPAPAPPPEPQTEEIEVQIPEDFSAFDGARATVAQALAVMSGQVKPGLNQLLRWIEGQDDPRWDQVFEKVDEANEDFNRLYRSMGRALGYLDPTHIEGEES